jgi:hypothetical protein
MNKKLVSMGAALVFAATLFSPVIAGPTCGATCPMGGKPAAKASKAKGMTCPMMGKSAPKGKAMSCPMMSKGKATKSKAMACGKNCRLKQGKPCVCPKVTAKGKAMSCGDACVMKKGKPCVCPKTTKAKAKTHQ